MNQRVSSKECGLLHFPRLGITLLKFWINLIVHSIGGIPNEDLRFQDTEALLSEDPPAF